VAFHVSRFTFHETMSRQTSFLPPETEAERLERMQRYERTLRRQGFLAIAGVDEAGRGCLAGPVVAAAVILPPDWVDPEVNDSKQLGASKREELFVRIQEHAVSHAVGIISEAVIDRVNILQATYLAMEQAVTALQVPPQYLLIDALTLPNVSLPQQGITKGDSLSLSIAAASIVAKVTRDRLMVDYDRQYPGYGFAGHKGYGTKQHLHAIATLGLCPIHRKTFRGVKEHLPE
jgi:ribonuclease HII